MKLVKRFSAQPLLELRSDYGSADGRTVANRPYVWFEEMLEDGTTKRRMKVINLPVEQAIGFVEVYLDRFLAISGQVGARQQIHDFLKLFEFDVRSTVGRPRLPVATETATGEPAPVAPQDAVGAA